MSTGCAGGVGSGRAGVHRRRLGCRAGRVEGPVGELAVDGHLDPVRAPGAVLGQPRDRVEHLAHHGCQAGIVGRVQQTVAQGLGVHARLDQVDDGRAVGAVDRDRLGRHDPDARCGELREVLVDEVQVGADRRLVRVARHPLAHQPGQLVGRERGGDLAVCQDLDVTAGLGVGRVESPFGVARGRRGGGRGRGAWAVTAWCRRDGRCRPRARRRRVCRRHRAFPLRLPPSRCGTGPAGRTSGRPVRGRRGCPCRGAR